MQDIKYANCFVCGADNPVDLKLDFGFDETSAFTTFDSPACFEGYEGVIHGGIIATLMDEAMAKIILSRKLVAVTANMNIRYRKPLPVGTKVTVSAEITEQKTRTIHARAFVKDNQNNVFAESESVFIVVKKLDAETF